MYNTLHATQYRPLFKYLLKMVKTTHSRKFNNCFYDKLNVQANWQSLMNMPGCRGFKNRGYEPCTGYRTFGGMSEHATMQLWKSYLVAYMEKDLRMRISGY